MKYLTDFNFPTRSTEDGYLDSYFSCVPAYEFHEIYYPFRVLSRIGLSRMSFSDITILYGGNSQGKSTILNIIAQKLNVIRSSRYDFGEQKHMQAYVDYCSFETDNSCRLNGCRVSKMVTSDDISEYIREGRETRIYQIIERMKRLGRVSIMLVDRDEKDSIPDTDDSFMYLSHNIEDEGLYLLDEPEACLSAEMQMRLHNLILNKARYNDSQFIIATHSPFLLGIPGAKIYNLDVYPASETRFGDLPSIKTYRQFLAEQEHSMALQNEDGAKNNFHPLFLKVARMVVETQDARTSSIQREFNLRYNIATRIMDQLESVGIVTPCNSQTHKRYVLVKTDEELMKILQSLGLVDNKSNFV